MLSLPVWSGGDLRLHNITLTGNIHLSENQDVRYKESSKLNGPSPRDRSDKKNRKVGAAEEKGDKYLRSLEKVKF